MKFVLQSLPAVAGARFKFAWRIAAKQQRFVCTSIWTSCWSHPAPGGDQPSRATLSRLAKSVTWPGSTAVIRLIAPATAPDIDSERFQVASPAAGRGSGKAAAAVTLAPQCRAAVTVPVTTACLRSAASETLGWRGWVAHTKPGT